MTRMRLRSAIIASYLFLCILLGGSGQGHWLNLALQVAGIAVIAWVAIAARNSEAAGSTLLHSILLASLALVLLQLIPLPAGVWTNLAGRGALAEDFTALGMTLPSLPLSLTPDESLMTLFAAIPAVAIFLATEKLQPSPRWLAAAILVAMVLGIGLGAIQVAGGPDSSAYLHPIHTNQAAGFFANGNHMATLLLVAIPFTAALIATSKSSRRSNLWGQYGTAGIVLALVVAGIALNRSLAALALSVPVLIASVSLVPAGSRWRSFALPLAAVALAGGIALIASNPISSGPIGIDNGGSVESRATIWANTGRAIDDYRPFGTGLGSFERVYQQYEDPTLVSASYVNHAHNDYLELVLELGVPGFILILLFLGWWGVAAVRIWASPLSSPFGRAATIATAAVLAHSIVDFPLRTAAIAAIFGASIALMTQRSSGATTVDSEQRRPARHVRIG
jgi:O-antigen ligase